MMSWRRSATTREAGQHEAHQLSTCGLHCPHRSSHLVLPDSGRYLMTSPSTPPVMQLCVRRSQIAVLHKPPIVSPAPARDHSSAVVGGLCFTSPVNMTSCELIDGRYLLVSVAAIIMADESGGINLIYIDICRVFSWHGHPLPVSPV